MDRNVFWLLIGLAFSIVGWNGESLARVDTLSGASRAATKATEPTPQENINPGNDPCPNCVDPPG